MTMMTKDDRYRHIQDHLSMLAHDVADIKSDAEEEAKADAHLAGLMIDLLKEFSATGRIPLPENMRDMMTRYLEAGILMDSVENKVKGIADAIRRK